MTDCASLTSGTRGVAIPPIPCNTNRVNQTRPMRKIERLMNAAITSEKDFTLDNTHVTTKDGVSFVFLHGNNIAQIGDTWLRLFDGGWQTVTTKSRLNAILAVHGNGERVFQKNFNWFVSTNDGDVEFESGMKLA